MRLLKPRSLFLLLYRDRKYSLLGKCLLELTRTFKATLPSLWISILEILRSGLSDVWASYVAKLLCCLTPYLWPFLVRPGQWRLFGSTHCHNHLPKQKRLNSSSIMDSRIVSPVMSPSSSQALRKSVATKSTGMPMSMEERASST